MSKKGVIKLAGVSLTLALFAFALSCGGGGGSKLTLSPSPTPTTATSHGGNMPSDYVEGMVFTEAELANLSPELRALFAHPGWDGPATPVPPAGPAPVPELPTLENVSWGYGEQVVEDAIPSRSASYIINTVPATEEPVLPGDYKNDVYDNNPPSETPPWGSDSVEAGGQGDGIEDRFEYTNGAKFTTLIGKSYTWRGVPKQNFFNSGSGMTAPENSMVYQSYQTETGPFYPWVEVGYRGDQTYAAGFTDDVYFIGSPIYELWQSTFDEVKAQETVFFKVYDVLVAPVSDEDLGPGGEGYESLTFTGGEFQGLGTKASVQWFSKDTSAGSPMEYPLNDPNLPINCPPYADSVIVKLISSENEDIQKIIDKRFYTSYSDPNAEPPSNNYEATFPVFGVIFQRWADDSLIYTDPPWLNRLGWPVSPPKVMNGGFRLIGEDGYQFLRFQQSFERGIIVWDWIFGNRPHRAWIFTIPEDAESIFDVTDPDDLIQDEKIVRYGHGGPLGVIAWEWPGLLNVGEPAYFKAFPFGGPLDNSFADDFFLWRFRDGTYGFGQYITKQVSPKPYDYMTSYIARVMLVLNYPDGTGAPNANFVAFGDTNEFLVGVKSPGGGGGGATILLIDMDSDDQHLNKWKGDLDAEGLGYDVKPVTDVISNPSLMGNYKVSILVPNKDINLSVWGPRGGTWNQAIENPLMDFVKGGGKAIVFMTQWYFRDQTDFGNIIPWEFRCVFGGMGGYYGWYCYSCGTGILTGYPLASGPGGNFTSINFQYKENHLESHYFSQDITPYQHTHLIGFEYSSIWQLGSASHHPTWNGGKGVGAGTEWAFALSTSPPSGGTGTSKFLLNLFNWVDPAILQGGGGGGGAAGFAKYVGPVQIGDPTLDPPRKGLYAWLISPGATPPAMISGGDGSDAFSDPHPNTADLSIVTEPGTMHFEAMAHGDPDEDGEDQLGYQWRFYPAWMFVDDPDGPDDLGEWQTWPRYTEHQYTGGIDGDITNDYDGDGDPTNDYGEPFKVMCRVWDADQFSSFDDAVAADPDGSLGYWAIDGVYVIVRGPKDINVEDDGTTFNDSYMKDQNGNVSFDLAFFIEGGEPEAIPGTYYDRVAVDVDYEGFPEEFDPAGSDTADDVEVLIGSPPHYPGYGHTDYTVTTGLYQYGQTYTVAIYAEDDAAPNFYDIYVWPDAIKVAAPLLVVNDGGTDNLNAITTDLQGLGIGYTTMSSSQITSSDQIKDFSIVIWACPQSTYQFSSSERNIIKDYILNKGGNFFLPYNYWYYDSWSPFDSTFNSAIGSYYWFSWYIPGYISVPSSSYDGKQHIWRSGYPGSSGQYVVSLVYTQYVSFYTDIYYYYRAYYTSNSTPICGEYGWDPWYEGGACRHNSSTPDKNYGACVGFQWNHVNQNNSTNNASVNRKELLARILKFMKSDVI